MNKLIQTVVFTLFLAAIGVTSIAHEPLPTPKGRVILTVIGNQIVSNHEGRALFDLEMLQALPVTQYETHTIWTEGVQSFQGVRLKDLFDRLDAKGAVIRVTALNDYSIDIPLNEASFQDAMIAYQRNGAPMPVRKKGPLWIVFPFDSDQRYRSEVYFSRSVWQLHKIEIRY
jgi:hypothetical protein